MTDMQGIREVEIQKGEDGATRSVRLVFGPHYFVQIEANADGGVDFVLGATHHGFRADASEVNGQLEKIVNEVRGRHPDLVVD